MITTPPIFTSASGRCRGQFFTPVPVVDFIWDALTEWGVMPRPGVQVLDPACGEGIFLRRAWERGLAGWDALHGWEVDPAARGWWRERGMGGWPRLAVRDALADAWEAPGFDLVIGNPPYGYPVERASGAGGLARYAAWGLLGEEAPAARCPVEVLFLERFARLARPGGWVAVILPEGLFVKRRCRRFRDWLLTRLQPRAIVALPRVTFGPAGASAKTAVLFAQRWASDERRARNDPRPTTNDAGEVLLFAPEGGQGRRESLEPYLRGVLKALQRLPGQRPPGPPIMGGECQHSPPIIGGPGGLSIRSPLPTASLSGHPWNPEYWDTSAGEALGELAAGTWPLSPLGRLDAEGREVGFIRYTTYGAVGRRVFVPEGVRYVGPRNLTPTGVEFRRQERFVARGGPNDPARSRLQEEDILLCNSGVACVGRPAIFSGYGGPANIAQHINLIRVAGIDPFYVTAYLHTRFARAQLRRFQAGTGAAGINFAQIRALQLPVPPPEVQAAVRRDYLAMHAAHRAALHEQALTLLDDLIRRLEATLLGQGHPPDRCRAA